MQLAASSDIRRVASDGLASYESFIRHSGCDAGHYENLRDVLQLTNDLSALPEQQGYLQCMALPSATAAASETQQPQRDINPARLTHFFLRVSSKMRAHGDLATLAQFEQATPRRPQTYLPPSQHHAQLLAPVQGLEYQLGVQVATESFRPATCGVMAAVTLKPPLRLTNALPFPATFTVLEVWYGEEGMHAQPRLTESQDGQRVEFVSNVKNAAVVAGDWIVGLPEDQKLRDAIFDKCSPIHSQVLCQCRRPGLAPPTPLLCSVLLAEPHRAVQAASGTHLSGRHIVRDVEKGAAMNLYADLQRTILVFLHIPGLRMGSAVWSVLNWGAADRDRGFRWEALPLAGPSDPKKLPELPQFLHVVPHGVTFQQRRRQVMRRLANKITCGIVPANKGVARGFEPVAQHLAAATHAALTGIRRLDPSPHVAAASDTVQHGTQKPAPQGPAPAGDESGSHSSDSSAELPPSVASPQRDGFAEAGPSTRAHAARAEDDDSEEYRVPGTRYTAAQARLLLSALHAWRYAKTEPGTRRPVCPSQLCHV